MKFNSNIELQAGLEDNNAASGTSGQVLSSTGTGVAWIDQNTVPTDYYTETESDSRFVNVAGDTMTGDLTLNNSGQGWIKGYDAYHSIKFRVGGTNKTEYYEYGGTLADGLGHKFFTGGTTGQTLKFQVADDGSYFSGNLGIGTTGPGAKLQVNSAGLGSNVNNTTTQAIFNSSNSNQSNLYIQDYRTADGNDWTFSGKRIQEKIDSTWMGYMQFNGSGNNGGISFGTGTSTTQSSITEKLRINSSGNVGIGTNPSRKLDVNGDIRGYGNIQINSAATGSPYLSFQQNSDQKAAIQYSDSGDRLDFQTSGGYKFISGINNVSLIIEDNGYVGVGNITPDEQLTVDGNISATGTITGSNLSGTNTGDQDLSGYALTSHTHTWADINGETANSVNSWGGLRHQTNDGYIDFGPANTGTAHIYTDRPSFYFNKSLIVNGSSTVNMSDIRAKIFYDVDDTGYYLDPASTSRLNHGNFISTLSFGNFTTGSQGTIFEGYSTHSVVRTDSARLDFYMGKTTTGVGTMMSLTDTGNVGIGTTSPTDYKLDVVNTNDGTTGIGPFRVSAQANAGTVAVFENTVGINTSLKISDTVDDMYVVSRNGIMGLGPSGGWSSTNINISSAGNVGIGDRNPSTNHKLTVKRNGGYGIKVDGTQIGFYQGTTFRGSIGPQIDSSLFDINGQSNIRFKINNSLVGRWNSGGYFGIGTQDPDFPLDINRSDAKARIWSTSGNASALVLKGGNGQILFEDASGTTDFLMLNRGNNFAFKKSSAGQEYIYITTSGSSDGNIGIGSNFDQQNLPSAKLEVDGNILATGDVVAYYSSDERLKDNIKPIENALDKVESIGGYTFDWNDKQSTYEGSDIGVIAQEIEAIAPELVTERETGYKAVKYDKLVAVLIESIKELSAKVKTLEAKLQ